MITLCITQAITYIQTMAEIDFITEIDGGFGINLDGAGIVSGNRALLNRFTITFLTEQKTFMYGGVAEVDTYGGNSMRYLGSNVVLSNLSAIGAAITTALDDTARSIMQNQDQAPKTEQLSSANLEDLIVIDGVITAKVNVVPVEIEPWVDISLNLPITRYI